MEYKTQHKRKDAFKFTATLADQLGLELAIAGSPGWSVTGGPWVVLRLGYSLIGTMNHPASPEASGLEVDKLSRKYTYTSQQFYRADSPLLPSGLLGPVRIVRSAVK